MNDSTHLPPKMGNDMEALNATELQERLAALRSVARDMSIDIKHWIALAERQRCELPDVDHLPCGPCIDGINGSKGLLERFQVVLRDVNKFL